MGTILLVDDDKDYCKKFAEIMKRQADLQVDWTNKPEETSQLLSEKSFSLVLLDLMFNGRPLGFDVLKDIVNEPFCPYIVIISNSSDTRNAVKATKLGAYDYIEKEWSLNRVSLSIKNALDASSMENELRRHRNDERKKYQIIGEHPKTIEMVNLARKVANSDQTVLITGESGTGKELVARALHYHSSRVSKPFIAINCAALSRELIESELFGHEKGSFTGAVSSKKGKFELVGEGTLFLDEITETSLESQAKLLRVLQEREFERVGGNEVIDFKGRLISSTNRIIEDAITDGKLREDLYYRLNVLNIEVPPLRNRKSDIPLLFNYYLKLELANSDRMVPDIENDVMPLLQAYSWPNNVRHLENLARGVAIMHGEGPITSSLLIQYLPQLKDIHNTDNDLKSVRDMAERAERDEIIKALKRFGGNVKKAASHLQMSHWNLYKKMKKHNIDSSDY